MKNIAIFASGNGTNAQCIIEYFLGNKNIKIALVLSNKKDAYVLERAKKFDVRTFIFSNKELQKTNKVLDILSKYCIDLVVLAGFLLKIPNNLIHAYSNLIINIHPALLPKYGGKGMYGNFVHEAVIKAGEIESGITIHYVNEKYDEGKIIFQAKCEVLENDTPESLSQRIHFFEHKHYPCVIEKLLTS